MLRFTIGMGSWSMWLSERKRMSLGESMPAPTDHQLFCRVIAEMQQSSPLSDRYVFRSVGTGEAPFVGDEGGRVVLVVQEDLLAVVRDDLFADAAALAVVVELGRSLGQEEDNRHERHHEREPMVRLGTLG